MTKAERQQMLEEKLQSMQEYERKLHAEGISYIAGVDEVGRGPLAAGCDRLRCSAGGFFSAWSR